MNGHVLVLNQDYQPLSVCGVRKSLMLLFLEKAELLHPLSDRKIHTVSSQFDFPSVIRLRRYARIPFKTIVLSRKNVLKRDGNRCQYCGSCFPTSELSIDHVNPRTQGGLDTWENLVCACVRCNARKGGRTPEQAHMKLIAKPVRPKRNPAIVVRLGQQLAHHLPQRFDQRRVRHAAIERVELTGDEVAAVGGERARPDLQRWHQRLGERQAAPRGGARGAVDCGASAAYLAPPEKCDRAAG